MKNRNWRVVANRSNAQHSTGPKTPQGKANSSRNATMHGMTSKSAVLPHESMEEYEAMREGLVEAHKPANDHERTLISQIAQAYWRLQRCYGVERAFLENRIAAASDEDPESAIANLFVDKVESGRMRLLMRYLGSAERAYYKAVADLQKAQAERRKQEREEAAQQAFAELYAAPKEPKAAPIAGFVSHNAQAADLLIPASACEGLQYAAAG